MSELVVSLDQDICIACGLCSEIAPLQFYAGEHNFAYVKDAGPEDPVEAKYIGLAGRVAVGNGIEDAVIEAAEECPVECIYVEVSDDGVLA